MPGGRPLRRTVRVGVAVAPMKQLTHTVAVSRTKRRNSPVSQSLGHQKLQPDVVFFGWNRAVNVLISDHLLLDLFRACCTVSMGFSWPGRPRNCGGHSGKCWSTTIT